LKKHLIPKKLRPGRKPPEEPIVERKIQTIDGEKFSWIDLQNPDRKDVEKLAEKGTPY